MSLNDQYKSIKFKQSVRELVREYYGAEDDDSEHTKKLKYKIEGFFEAGLLVDAATKEDIQLIVDEEHMAAFGMTRLQRRVQKSANENLKTMGWAIYDQPAIESKKINHMVSSPDRWSPHFLEFKYGLQRIQRPGCSN